MRCVVLACWGSALVLFPASAYADDEAPLSDEPALAPPAAPDPLPALPSEEPAPVDDVPPEHAAEPPEQALPASPAPSLTTASDDTVPSDTARSAKLHTGFGLGFAAGATSGIGIAYRHHFENGFGLQLAGIGFGGQDNITANAGVNVMYTFARAWLARFYAVAGSMFVYSGGPEYDWSQCVVRPEDPIPPGGEVCEPKVSGWNNRYMPTVGAGIGIEFHFTENIGLALELPLSLWLAFDDNGFLPRETRVWPIPNGSLVYYF